MKTQLQLDWRLTGKGFWRAKTPDVTCVVRQHKTAHIYLWTISRRGTVPPGQRRLIAHGRADLNAAGDTVCIEVERVLRHTRFHPVEALPPQPSELHISDKQNPPLASSMPPCVYFVGADRGGKTTLCRYVRDAYGLPMLGEAARMVLHRDEDDFARIRATGASASKYQCDVFNRQLREEDATKAPYVSDRAFDNLAYASEHGRNFKELYDALPPAYLERLRASVVFFVKPAHDIFLAGAADPVRARTDWDAVQRISAKVEMLLQLLDIPHVTIAESIASRREELIDYTLSMKGHRKHG